MLRNFCKAVAESLIILLLLLLLQRLRLRGRLLLLLLLCEASFSSCFSCLQLPLQQFTRLTTLLTCRTQLTTRPSLL